MRGHRDVRQTNRQSLGETYNQTRFILLLFIKVSATGRLVLLPGDVYEIFLAVSYLQFQRFKIQTYFNYIYLCSWVRKKLRLQEDK